MIDNYFSYKDFASWALDTKCTSQICNDHHQLTSKHKLRKSKVELRMRNDVIVSGVALGVVNLNLSSGDSFIRRMLLSSSKEHHFSFLFGLDGIYLDY